MGKQLVRLSDLGKPETMATVEPGAEQIRLEGIIRRANRSEDELIQMCASYMLLYRESRHMARAQKRHIAALTELRAILESRNSAPKKGRGRPREYDRRRLTDYIDAQKHKLGVRHRADVLRREIVDFEKAKGRNISKQHLEKRVAAFQKRLLPAENPISESPVLAALMGIRRGKGRPAKPKTRI